MSELLEAAVDYASQGHPVFPCWPLKKTPMPTNGLHAATVDIDQVVSWWTETPNANIAIATGNVTVIDIDPVEGKENPWLMTCDERVLELFAGIQSITPRGGRHLWFRTPDAAHWRNSTSKLAQGVDVRASGGYVLAPPSRVKDEKSDGVYKWIPDAELDCPASGLKYPPQWVSEELSKQARSVVAPGERSKWDTEEAPIFRAGGRNDALTRIAGNLRFYGYLREEIEAMLLQVNAKRVDPPLSADEVLKIAESVSRYRPNDIASDTFRAIDRAEVKEAAREARKKSPTPKDPGPLPDEFLNPGGALGDYIDFTVSRAHRPQPVLALAAGLSLLSVLAGRKVRDATGTRTNIYTLGVAPSGSGKEFARQVNKKILVAAGAGDLIGPEGWASHAGIVTAISMQPAQLQQVDEIGRVIEAANQKNAGAHLFHISTVLMKLYSSAGTVYRSDGYADAKRNIQVHQPCLTVYGTTVPRSLFEGLTTESLSDGFLARMLVFCAEDGLPEPGKSPGLESLPESLVSFARSWFSLSPGGNLSSVPSLASDCVPEPLLIPETDEARIVYETNGGHFDEQHRAGGCSGTSAIWARAVEKARKLALLKAISDARGDVPQSVTSEAADWGCRLAEYLTRKILFVASAWVSETEFDRNQQRILRIIREAGKDGVSMTEINRKTRGLRPRERAECLDSLRTMGDVVDAQVPTATKPRTVLKLAEFD